MTILAYLDDIFAVGEVDRVLRALTDLKSSLVNIGLSICERKCELYSTFSDNESSISVPVTTQGTVILGVPIGCKEFVQNWCNEFAVSGKDLCSKFADLDNPQASTLLWRRCHIPGVNYLARAVFPKWFDRAAQIHDGLTRTTFLDILGLSSSGERSWNQASLSVKFGGFGLTQIQQVSNAAFVAAWVSSLKQLPN